MEDQVAPPLRWLGVALLGRSAEPLDLLVIIPFLVNFLWILDVGPQGALGWVLTVLMCMSAATWISVKLGRWRRQRRVNSAEVLRPGAQ